jgi:hypothetical protein
MLTVMLDWIKGNKETPIHSIEGLLQPYEIDDVKYQAICRKFARNYTQIHEGDNTPVEYLVHEALTRQYDGTGVYIQIENIMTVFVRIFHPDVVKLVYEQYVRAIFAVHLQRLTSSIRSNISYSDTDDAILRMLGHYLSDPNDLKLLQLLVDRTRDQRLEVYASDNSPERVIDYLNFLYETALAQSGGGVGSGIVFKQCGLVLMTLFVGVLGAHT